MTSRKKKAWARAKHTLLKGLDGDVWSRASRKHKGDNNDHGWEDNDIDKGEEEDLMARTNEKTKGSARSIVLVTKQSKSDMAWYFLKGMIITFLLASPFLILHIIFDAFDIDEKTKDEVLGLTYLDTFIALVAVIGSYYVLHFILIAVLEIARQHFQRHNRLFFVAMHLWNRAINCIIIIALYVIKYSDFTLLHMSNKGSSTIETLLKIVVAYEVIFLIADYVGIAVAAKYFWAPQAERSRGPIICQGLCKILIEHVRGKDTVKEQKFCLRVLDGYPLFYQPIYISGALVISTALTELVDTATRGEALAQAYAGKKEMARDRLIDQAAKKDKTDTTMAIHYLYDHLVDMGKVATALPTPVDISSDATKTIGSDKENVESAKDCLSVLSDHSYLSSLDGDTSVLEASSTSSSIMSDYTDNFDSDVLHTNYLKPFLHKRLAIKLLQSMSGDRSVHYIAKEHFTYWYMEVIKARRLQGVNLSDVEEMLCLLLNVIYIFAGVVVGIFAVAQISKDYQATLLSLSTFILAFSFMFGSSASVLFDSCVFIMATHPYDVGDRVYIIGDKGDEENMEVVKVNLLTTEFLREDGHLMVIQNVKMIGKDIRNMNRSPFSSHCLYVAIPPLTDWELVEEFRKRMNEFKRDRRDLKLKVCEVCVRDLHRNGLRILVYVEQRVSFQDNSLRYKVLEACEEEIVLVLRRLGIDVTSGVAIQPIELLSDSQLNSITRNRFPSSMFSNASSSHTD